MNIITKQDTEGGEEHFPYFYMKNNLDFMPVNFRVSTFRNTGEKNSFDPDSALSL